MIQSIIALICVMSGASLQFYFSRQNETKKQNDLLKFSAYADFFRGLAGSSISHKNPNKEKEMEFKIQIADAKARISVYGDDSVIEKIAYYLRMNEVLSSPDSEKALVDIIVEIRKKHNSSAIINTNDISQLILGTDIEKNKIQPV